MNNLVDLYFSRLNIFLPLLHRPTFEMNMRDGLHFRNQAFGSVLLCLCACAARYSDDPRVLLDGSTSWHSSGWKWFSQVQTLRRSLMGPPLLYDVQMYAVRPHFLSDALRGYLISADVIHAARLLIFAGVLDSSVMLDVGWCRYSTYSGYRNASQEDVCHHGHCRGRTMAPGILVGTTLVCHFSYRLMFLVSHRVHVVLDRLMGASFGRPCAIQEEEYVLLV